MRDLNSQLDDGIEALSFWEYLQIILHSLKKNQSHVLLEQALYGLLWNRKAQK